MGNPEEYHRTRRIVEMLLRIANQPRRWRRIDLAGHYEVSERQIDKDLQVIRHGLRMPLRHAPEGYYFETLAALPTLTLSLPEALALLLAARLGQQMPGVSRSDLAAAIARLETLLPPRLIPWVGRLEAVDGANGGQRSLMELQLAVAEGAQVSILYRSASAGGVASRRKVDPYTLLPHLRSWYLVGYCHQRRDVRMFKVDRIEALDRTGARFQPPESFDLEGYLGQVWGLVKGEAGEPEEVVLEFEPETGRWARDQAWHPSQEAEELPEGRVRLTFHAGITPEMRRWVLGFGTSARVIRPESLGEWVRGEARRMVDGEEAARNPRAVAPTACRCEQPASGPR